MSATSTHALLAAALCASAAAGAAASRDLRTLYFQQLAKADGVFKHKPLASDHVVIKDLHDKLTTYDTKYHVVLRSGDQHGDGTFGLLYNIDGEPLTCGDADKYSPGDPCYGRSGEPKISDGADFSSLMPKGDKIYGITHFEAPPPAASYLSTLSQDPDTGKLTVEKTENMDWSALGGLWTPCAGSVTPWNTHFGSEEYEPDARAFEDLVKEDPSGNGWKGLSKYEEHVTEYLKVPEDATNAEVAEEMHPYLYGYPWQAWVHDDGSYEVAKHYAMGRVAIELPLTMPDKKTVYITDDGDNVMLVKYVADKEGELDCGQLYGAKFTQTSANNGGDFMIDWIKVGPKACDKDIEPYLRNTKFYDLFDAANVEDNEDCPKGYTSINTSAGRECLKLRRPHDGMSAKDIKMLASRFELRRYAAMHGATTEFAKWEGITLDTKRNRLYTAMSEVRRGMEDYMKEGEHDPSYDIGGPNDVRVNWNPCGCVYYLDLDDHYSAINMKALVCGDTEYFTDENNECNIHGIANPDNVNYVPGHDGLVIGEDTGSGHQNDVMWYYDLNEDSMTRFMSTPYGSETTSPYWYSNINGWGYLMAVIQHPYGESDQEKIDEPAATGWQAYVGYIGPFKALDMEDDGYRM